MASDQRCHDKKLDMNTENTAECLAELGHVARLSLLVELMKQSNQGVPVGNLQKALDIPGSTLSHHLSRLIKVGLVTQRREGRTLYCVAEMERLQGVVEFLNQSCNLDQYAVES